MAGANLLDVSDLRKSFFGVPVLHGVSFSVGAGEALGLVGENGSGKSTSLNILGGVHQPDGGAMTLNGEPYAPASPRDATNAGIAFIHQELNLFPNLTVEENLFIDGFPTQWRLPLIDRGAIRARTLDALRQVDLHSKPSTPVAQLSQGERQLVEIAKALSRNARLIIFDEPTTSLTRPEVERLFQIIERLKQRGIGVIYVSHALEDVMAICDKVTVLRDGHLAGEGRVEDLTLQRIISMMVGRSIDTIYPERAGAEPGAEVVEVSGLTHPGVAENVSFSIRAGEIVGLAGLMGSGRSELARMIFGLDSYARGSVAINGKNLAKGDPRKAIEAGVALLTEDRRGEGLLMDATISENFVLASLANVAGALGLLDGKKVNKHAVDMAHAMRLSTDKVDTTQAKHLSGGNQQKVVIGKWLLREPRLFILDEPTRGIDVGAKQEVYRIVNGLVERGNAILLISSEIEELIGLADRILVISRGELTGAFECKPFDRNAIMAAATGVGATLEAAQ